MSQTDFVPSRDADLDAFAINFSALITATPTAYGLVAADATALAALVTAYSSALAAAINPATRTPVTVGSKDTARAVLIASIRSLARRIQAYPPLTSAQRISLGLTVKDVDPSPVPAPATRPLLALLSNFDRTQRVRLVDETTPTRRGKPSGVAGAQVYSFVPTASEDPPADLEQWRFEGFSSKTDFNVDFGGADVGKTAYIVALWQNAKGEVGPRSAPSVVTVAA